MANPVAHPLVLFGGWLKSFFKTAGGAAVAVEKSAVAMVTPTPTIASVLAPFQTAVSQLDTVEAAARAEEQALRAQAASVLVEADGVARQVQQAMAVKQNLSKLLGLQ